MKRLTLILLLLAFQAFSTDMVFFNPASSPVPNKVTSYALSLNEVVYRGDPGALAITNRAVQIGAGVTFSNLTLVCVVDSQLVRLYNQSDLDRISASNVIWAAEAVVATSNALVATKLEARQTASNVVAATDGNSLFLRSLSEANWFLINQIRTNAGNPALSKGTYLQMIYTNINSFGQ